MLYISSVVSHSPWGPLFILHLLDASLFGRVLLRRQLMAIK